MKKTGDDKCTMKECSVIEEYAAFCDPCECIETPEGIACLVRDDIRADLNPTGLSVFLRLLLVHSVSALITLSICPQFGVGPIGGGAGIAAWVEQYGHFACGLFCGAVFVGLSALLSMAFLRKEVQRVIQKEQWVMFSALAIISIIALMIFSTMLNGRLPHLHIEFIVPWLAACILLPILLYIVREQTLSIKQRA